MKVVDLFKYVGLIFGQCSLPVWKAYHLSSVINVRLSFFCSNWVLIVR